MHALFRASVLAESHKAALAADQAIVIYQ